MRLGGEYDPMLDSSRTRPGRRLGCRLLAVSSPTRRLLSPMARRIGGRLAAPILRPIFRNGSGICQTPSARVLLPSVPPLPWPPNPLLFPLPSRSLSLLPSRLLFLPPPPPSLPRLPFLFLPRPPLDR